MKVLKQLNQLFHDLMRFYSSFFDGIFNSFPDSGKENILQQTYCNNPSYTMTKGGAIVRIDD